MKMQQNRLFKALPIGWTKVYKFDFGEHDMKKTAVLIYNQFCNFEISVALEILDSMAEVFLS